MTFDQTTDVPLRQVEAPAAWYGRDLRDSDEWIEPLTPVEIDELLAAVDAVEQRGLTLLEMQRGGLLLADARSSHSSSCRRAGSRSGLLADARTPDR